MLPEIAGYTVPKVLKIQEKVAENVSRFFFSKRLAKYFLRYRDLAHFLGVDYNRPFVSAPSIIFCVKCSSVVVFYNFRVCPI